MTNVWIDPKLRGKFKMDGLKFLVKQSRKMNEKMLIVNLDATLSHSLFLFSGKEYKDDKGFPEVNFYLKHYVNMEVLSKELQEKIREELKPINEEGKKKIEGREKELEELNKVEE